MGKIEGDGTSGSEGNSTTTETEDLESLRDVKLEGVEVTNNRPTGGIYR